MTRMDELRECPLFLLREDIFASFAYERNLR